MPGSGDITPLGGALLDLAHVHFTGPHYAARLTGKTITIAEAETATGHYSGSQLDALTEVAKYLPRP